MFLKFAFETIQNEIKYISTKWDDGTTRRLSQQVLDSVSPHSSTGLDHNPPTRMICWDVLICFCFKRSTRKKKLVLRLLDNVHRCLKSNDDGITFQRTSSRSTI
mmetsp:Transcript_12708/g.18727  ORF Transcript_12708/g.18727 Transcript_12708/m.18727 type:complete len:104 (+) Transcript_12708:123-434(+)